MEHRADAVFALPRLPTTATVFGDLPAWETDLAERGIQLVRRSPDLAVAAPAAVGEALASEARSVIVDSGRKAGEPLSRDGFSVRRLLPLPVEGTPVAYVDVEARQAAAYGLRHALPHAERWRALRNRAVAALAARGMLPPLDGVVIVAAREPGPPELLTAATGLGAPREAGWLMLVSAGSAIRRNALALFPPGASRPQHVVKFSRIPGQTDQFDREQRGFGLVERAGGSLAARAPDYLGRGELRGHHLSVESAAAGTKLANLLHMPGSRRRKLAVLESIAGWLVQVARETAAAPPALEPELRRLAREVLPVWAAEGAPQEIDPSLAAAIPASFQHNDMAEENLIVGASGFTAVDWEWVEPRGLPLGDLVYFGSHVLRLLDGARLEDQRDQHFEALVTGRAGSSPILFRWLRDLVEALAIPAEAVGLLVTLMWLDQGAVSARERRNAEAASGRRLEPAYAERCARTWLRHPALGPAWTRWREDR